MKQLNIFLIFILAMSFGCDDNTIDNSISVDEQLAIDITILDNWFADTTITDVIEHTSDIRYTVNKAGNGTTSPGLSDVVEVTYEGRFLDTGEVFDSNFGFPFILSQTIWGWQIMLQEMKEGDEFTIYLPSKYSYGPRGNGGIPPNAILVFDITLISINN